MVRQEEDSDFDGTIDKKSAAGAGGTQIQQADTNGDGAIDTWITTNAAGEVIKKDEDRSGDGKADLVAWFEGGQLSRLEQDTGRGCVDLKQWFDGNGKVRAEYKDANGDCKIDAWSYFKNEVLVRQGVDNSGDGRPNVLNHLNGSGQLTIQEVASGDNGRNPDKKLFLDAAGQVTAQCLLDANKKKLNTRALVSGGVVGEVLIDTNGNGFADTRQVLSGGQLARLDADTNGDRKPDVIQTYQGGAVAFQDEDTDFDGTVDQRFQGQSPVAVPAGTPVAGGNFGKLGCGSFHRFWWKR